MFWTKFSELCHSRGESPNAVAAKVGVKSTGTVSGWKKGAVPRDGVLSAIASYFDVPVSYFSEEEKRPAIEGELTPYMVEVLELFKDADEENQKKLLELVRNGRNLMGGTKNG